jgi:hypothetical protein
MHQSFQRWLIERAVQGNAAKFRGRQQRIQRHLLRMADKGAVGFKTCVVPRALPSRV